MLFEVLYSVLIGLIAGTITGLIPGLHINLVALVMFSFSTMLLKITSPLVLAMFIVAMAITHTFIDFLPSIFFGAPADDTALAVLPGHSLLLEGKGYEAAKLTILGSYAALLLTLILSPLFIFLLPKIYPAIRENMATILIIASVFLITQERRSKFWAFIIFSLAGVIGIATLNLSILKQPLFPLLTGLFGSSMLAFSIRKRIKLPKQKISKVHISKKEVGKALWAGTIASPLCSFLPGLGAAQAAVLGTEVISRVNRKGFLVLLGAINTFVMGLSFISLYALSKPRTGASVFMGKLLGNFTLKELILLLCAMLIAGSVAVFLANLLSKFFCKYILRIDYRKICLAILVFLVAATIMISGVTGILVLVTATSLGIVAINKGVRRMHLMGSLLIPVILYFL
jgi:putative membrane protein